MDKSAEGMVKTFLNCVQRHHCHAGRVIGKGANKRLTETKEKAGKKNKRKKKENKKFSQK
jgi:hypothetical protein